MRRQWAVAGLCGAFLAGALTPASAVEDKLPDDAKAALVKSSELELIQLWPFDDGKPTPGKDYFHGYEVTRRVALKGEEARKLSDAVLKGIGEGRRRALCFDPGHGIRAVYEGKTYDFVISFRCKQILCIGPKGGVDATIATSDSPEKAVDLLLLPDAASAKDKDGK